MISYLFLKMQTPMSQLQRAPHHSFCLAVGRSQGQFYFDLQSLNNSALRDRIPRPALVRASLQHGLELLSWASCCWFVKERLANFSFIKRPDFGFFIRD